MRIIKEILSVRVRVAFRDFFEQRSETSTNPFHPCRQLVEEQVCREARENACDAGRVNPPNRRARRHVARLRRGPKLMVAAFSRPAQKE